MYYLLIFYPRLQFRHSDHWKLPAAVSFPVLLGLASAEGSLTCSVREVVGELMVTAWAARGQLGGGSSGPDM